MGADLQQLLRDTGFEPDPLDVDELRRDAARARRTRRVAAAGGAGLVAAVVVGVVLSMAGTPEPPEPPVIGPGPSPGETEPAPDSSDGWEVLPTGPVDGRTFPAVVWTGSELLVWGGEETQDRGTATGGLYDPASGSWRETAPAPLGAKTEHVAVWTGDEAIVCCGRGSTSVAAYDPDGDRWRELAAGPGVAFPVAVWTGERMIVAGGVRGGGTSASTGTYVYDPAADVWDEAAELPVVLERTATAVWTGQQMIVWPAHDPNDEVPDDHRVGWAYDPDSDVWSALPPAPVAIRSASLAWSGSEVYAVGASGDAEERLVAAAYDPATGSWRLLDPGLPAADGSEGNIASQAAVWSDGRLLVWSGYLATGLGDDTSVLLSYDPTGDRWQQHPAAPVLGWRPDLAWSDHGLFVIDPQAYLHYPADQLTSTDDTPPAGSTATGPSQTPEEAARDGVMPEVAALTFDERVEVPGPYGAGQTTRVETDDGVWVVSRMPRTTNGTADGCGLGATDDPDAVYRRDVICVVEYGEILLLDHDETRILRAFPLPGVPPQRVAVTDDAVWCARTGDGGLPDSMLCRIDRQTHDWRVRIFPHPTSPAFTNDGDARSGIDPATGQLWLPDHWVVDRDEVRYDPSFLAGTWSFDNGILVAARSPLVSADQGALRYDPATLAPVPPCALVVDTTAARTDGDADTVRLTTTIGMTDGSSCEPFYANLSWNLTYADGWPVEVDGETTVEPQLLAESDDPAVFTLELTNWCDGGVGAPATVIVHAGPYGQHPDPLDVLPSCQDDREPLRLTRSASP